MRVAPERYCPVSDPPVRRDHFGLALRRPDGRRLSRARPKVHDEICAANGLFVVLDDQNGIPQIAQLLQRTQQPIVVARMQTDRWLIQHIQYAAQAAIQSASPAECAAPLRRKVSPPNDPNSNNSVPRPAENRGAPRLPPADAPQFLSAAGVSCARILSTAARAWVSESPVKSAIDQSAEFHRQRSGTQTLAVTHGAGRRGHVAGHPFAIRIRTGILEIALQESQNSLERNPFSLDLFSRRGRLLWPSGPFLGGFPCNNMFCTAGENFSNGVSRANPCAYAASSRVRFSGVEADPGPSAPSNSGRDQSTIIFAGSKSYFEPSPLHAGHAP